MFVCVCLRVRVTAGGNKIVSNAVNYWVPAQIDTVAHRSDVAQMEWPWRRRVNYKTCVWCKCTLCSMLNF